MQGAWDERCPNQNDTLGLISTILRKPTPFFETLQLSDSGKAVRINLSIKSLGVTPGTHSIDQPNRGLYLRDRPFLYSI